MIVISDSKSNTDYRKFPEEAGPFGRGLSYLKGCTPYPWSLPSTIRISNTLIRAYSGRSMCVNTSNAIALSFQDG